MFGIDLIDASFLPAAFVALLAGLLSFLSPCVLPIVPPYLAYMGGVGVGDLRAGRRSAVVPALFFVLGLSTVFMILGFTASAFGKFFLSNQDWFATAAGIVVMIFGAHFLGVIRIPILDREARLDAGDRGGTSFGAYVLGLAFAFGWTPCIGPILAGILALAAAQETVAQGVGLLFVYSMGLGVPFILTGLGLNAFLRFFARYKRFIRWGEIAAGVLLIGIGLLLVSNRLSLLMRLMPSSLARFSM